MNSQQPPSHGRELHREFVGMLFALAIAEVAVEGATLVNSGLPFAVALSGYSHLILAALVISFSWVGWGWSKHSLSDVQNVFTRDFLELLVDLWLVILYFFIVKGAEMPVTGQAGSTIQPSHANEVAWVMVIFATYFVWDFLTKWGQRDDSDRSSLIQRGWASAVCAALAIVCYVSLPDSDDTAKVVLADISLVALLMLFRAMKLKNLSDLQTSHWARIATLFVAWLGFFLAAR